MHGLSQRGGLSRAAPAAGSACLSARRPRTAYRATDQQEAPSTSGSNGAAAPSPPEGQRVLREFRAFGGKVLETDTKLTGPEDQPDFWEGERFDAFGKAVERYFLPGLVVLGIICGGIAARSYEDGATAYIKPPSGPDDSIAIIDRATVESVLSGGAVPGKAPSILSE